MMGLFDFLKFVFEDSGRIVGFFFCLLALAGVFAALVPSINIHKHYDKEDKK